MNGNGVKTTNILLGLYSTFPYHQWEIKFSFVYWSALNACRKKLCVPLNVIQMFIIFIGGLNVTITLN